MPSSSPKLREKFGKRICTVRRNAGLSQEDLADAAELNRTSIGAIERGERNISLTTIAKLANALGLAASQLLTGL